MYALIEYKSIDPGYSICLYTHDVYWQYLQKVAGKMLCDVEKKTNRSRRSKIQHLVMVKRCESLCHIRWQHELIISFRISS